MPRTAVEPDSSQSHGLFYESSHMWHGPGGNAPRANGQLRYVCVVKKWIDW